MKQFLDPQTYCKRLPRKLRRTVRQRERSPLILLKLTQLEARAGTMEHRAMPRTSRNHIGQVWTITFRRRLKTRAKEAVSHKRTRLQTEACRRLLARQVNPDGGRNLPAPKVFRPSDVSTIHAPLELFLDQQTKFIDFVKQCGGIDYNKTRCVRRLRR